MFDNHKTNKPVNRLPRGGFCIFNQKRKHKLNDYFEVALYILATACFFYFLVRGIYAKTFQAVLTVVVLFLIQALVKFTKTEIFPALRFSILFFIFVSMILAKEFEFYSFVPYLDKIEHLFSGVILCFVGLLVFRKIIKNEETLRLHFSTAVWFSLFFAVAMAGCWEIYEFTTDQLFGLHSQNGSIVDTMGDIICGTVGAIATSLYLTYKGGRSIKLL